MAANSLDLPLNRHYSVVKHRCHQQISLIKLLDSNEFEVLNTNCFIDFTILEENFYFKHKANIEFSLVINNITTYDVVK